MKNFAIFAVALIITCTAVIADDSRYINAIRNCSSYSESGTVQNDGMNATSTKKILGWSNNRCVYQETVKYSGVTANINCRFTKPQLQELSSVMDAYNLTLKYSGEEVDVSSVSAVQNNPVVKAWSKYLQNPDVCTMDAQ